LLLLPIAFATAEISTSETSVDLQNGYAKVNNAFELELDEPVGNLTLIASPEARSVSITINGKDVSCLLQAEFARCGNLASGTHNVSLSYETDYLLGVVGKDTIIRYTDRLPYPAERQEVNLKLPIGYIIPRERGKDDSFYLSPTPKEVYSDGQRIILVWHQQGQELSISAVTRQVAGRSNPWILATLAFALLFAGAVSWIILRERRKAPEPEESADSSDSQEKPPREVVGLIDNEQQVVSVLKENGEVWQKEIQKSTGFSKAKVSRVIRNLEARGLITKTPYGNTNKIALKEETEKEEPESEK